MTMLKAMMRRKTDIFICTLAVLLMLPLCNVMAQSKEIRKKTMYLWLLLILCLRKM